MHLLLRFYCFYTTGKWAADGRVYTAEACPASWGAYIKAQPELHLNNRSLCCSWTYLHYRALCCNETCLQFSCLCCSWRCLHYIYSRGLSYTCTTEACAAPGLIYSVLQSGLSTLQRPVLLLEVSMPHHWGLSCTWTCLDTRIPAACATPGGVYSSGPQFFTVVFENKPHRFLVNLD
jgi:hypothetical protein